MFGANFVLGATPICLYRVPDVGGRRRQHALDLVPEIFALRHVRFRVELPEHFGEEEPSHGRVLEAEGLQWPQDVTQLDLDVRQLARAVPER